MTQIGDHTFEVDPAVLHPLIAAVRHDAAQLTTVGELVLPDIRFCRALSAAISRYDAASDALFTEAESIAESTEVMIEDAVAVDADTAASFERTLP
ncbi:hypothetical protein [Corynebacterium cystitidis]|uniref:Uncharacterized protein n=1 Tax=Corynebacterium cystitidis DSM 20524 TaxID=1121357 RepID=A0A1H9QTR6_9CORY|nr:hypothetical protein [Corynebacterium cystitidis]WJY81668.1 hypothetical protein CCYS_03515 [Corynebacterium cystitidis DSM 20524]SER63767.1 hypothetical protein SAMN05661109_00662 [Corynebacterium cystitidis DSM 20524]SNV85121.1 Uncharacterised protein [Corynebacterium cystitidis]